MMEWISVKDKLPVIDYKNKETSKQVLGWDGEKIYLVFYREMFKWDLEAKKPPVKQIKNVFHTFCKKCGGGDEITVTHWMELPKASNVK